eukprot:483210-Prorocentrum_minimum.AAC.7
MASSKASAPRLAPSCLPSGSPPTSAASGAPPPFRTQTRTQTRTSTRTTTGTSACHRYPLRPHALVWALVVNTRNEPCLPISRTNSVPKGSLRIANRWPSDVDPDALPPPLRSYERSGLVYSATAEPIAGGEAVYTQHVNQSREGRPYMPSGAAPSRRHHGRRSTTEQPESPSLMDVSFGAGRVCRWIAQVGHLDGGTELGGRGHSDSRGHHRGHVRLALRHGAAGSDRGAHRTGAEGASGG